jgi:nucleotide-binding universal stress UspA family protein
MKLLLCVNGAPTTRPTIDYGVWLASLIRAEVTLLGIVETQTQQALVEALLDEAGAQLEGSHIPARRLIVDGLSEDVIPAQAAQDEYLTLVGPLGRPFWLRWLRGRSIRRLLAALESPLLYVPDSRSRLERILICMGGIGHAANLASLAGQLALVGRAQVTLLHVVAPVTFDYPVTRAAYDDDQALLATDTLPARYLQAALDELQADGLATTVRVRRGHITQEILDETRRGDYDLVGLGSHYSAEGLRPYFTPNVTSEVAEAAGRPVLVVR